MREGRAGEAGGRVSVLAERASDPYLAAQVAATREGALWLLRSGWRHDPEPDFIHKSIAGRLLSCEQATAVEARGPSSGRRGEQEIAGLVVHGCHHVVLCDGAWRSRDP